MDKNLLAEEPGLLSLAAELGLTIFLDDPIDSKPTNTAKAPVNEESLTFETPDTVSR